jgi:hypothetical protein
MGIFTSVPASPWFDGVQAEELAILPGMDEWSGACWKRSATKGFMMHDYRLRAHWGLHFGFEFAGGGW